MARDPKRIKNALATVKEVLQKAELSPTPNEDGDGFDAHFSEDGPEVVATAQVMEEEKFVFYLEFVKKAPKKAIRTTTEFVTRANYGLTVGNFEMDVDSGSVRYKSSLDFSGSDLPDLLVRNIILSSIYCLETYAKVLFDVMDGKKTPMDAIVEAESAL